MALAQDVRRNRLLAALPADAYRRLVRHLRIVELPRLGVVFAPGTRADRVYFPLSGLSVILACDAGGRGVGVASVGREGALGVSAALGATAMPTEVLAQVPGHAVRLAASQFRCLARERPAFRRLIDRYLAAQFVEAVQGSMCHRVHSLDARLVRWLLTTRDRAESDEFPFTHESMALMVGGSRPRVSVVTQALEADGLITCRRGGVRVIDVPGLQARVCDCYATIREALDRVQTARSPSRNLMLRTLADGRRRPRH